MPVDPRIRLKNPALAGLLAFLVPGLGHLYQGRLIKSAIYFVCIFGLVLSGMAMGEWKVIAATRDAAPPDQRPATRMSIGFVAQASIGVMSIPALMQAQRYRSVKNIPQTGLDEPLREVPFQGVAELGTQKIIPLEGAISLTPERQQVTGRVTGRDPEGNTYAWDVRGRVVLGRPIGGHEYRTIDGLEIIEEGTTIGEFRAAGIRRPFWNWFEVPPDDALQNDLNRRLGKLYEMALVFTWIAGLLNILAIYDAIEGPAYGYGDEPESEPAEKKAKKSKSRQASAETPATASSTTTAT